MSGGTAGAAGEAISILLVEDRSEDAELILAELIAAGYNPTWTRVETETQYLAALQGGPDIVLSDYGLPSFSGPRALALLRQAHLDIPFILVSGTIGEERAVDAMREGVTDYLLKDRLGRLGAAVGAALDKQRLRAATRLAARQCREKDERFRATFETAVIGIAHTALDGRYMVVNAALCDLLGYSASEMLSLRSRDVTHVEDLAGDLRATRTILEGGVKCHALAQRFTRKDGGVVWVARTLSLVRDAAGEPLYFICLYEDLTAQRAAESALRASESFSRSTIDGLAQHLCVCDEAGVVIAVNKAWSDFASENGGGAQLSIGANYLATCDTASGPEAAQAREFAAGMRAVLEGTRHDFEMEYACHAPEVQRWFTGRVTRFDGSPRRVVVTHDPITGRVLAEARLQESEARYRATFEQAAVGIAHTSIDGCYLMVNRKFCEITGYTREEFQSMRRGQISHPEDRSLPSQRQELLDGNLDTLEAETRYVRKDGVVIWVKRTVSLVRDAAGVPLYFLRVIEDVSERRGARERAALLQETTLAISEAQDMDTALRVVLEKIGGATGWTYGQAWLPNEDSSELACRAAFNDGSAEMTAFHERTRTLRVHSGAALAVTAFLGKCATWVPDIAKAQFKRRESAIKAGFKSWAGIPVVTGDKAVALLEFFIRQSRPDDPRMLELVSVVATQLGSLFRRKTAEAASRESDEKFRQLAAHIPEVFWMTDAKQTHLTYVSPAYATLTGLSPGVAESEWGRPIHPDDREAAGRAWLNNAALGTYDIEYRMVHVNGTERWVHDRAFPIRDAQGGVLRIAGIIEDITDRRIAQARLLHLAHYDQLTDLPNRVLFYDRLKQALAQTRRSGRCTGVLLIDLDRFKAVNDTLGHAGGDVLLKAVSQRLTACLRPGDSVGRLGGDEFGVILSDLAAPQDAGIVAGEVLKSLTEAFRVDDHDFHTTASIGIALCPTDSDDIDMLIRNADTAMYGAKAGGRNAFRFYTAQMNELALEKLQLERQLRRALERGEFLLHYQPKVDIVTGEIVGCEALLRWASPDKGMVGPDRFIPLLEETGLIVPAGEWVIRTACAQIKAWKEARVRPVPIAVNLSARQFRQEGLSGVVAGALRADAVAPRLLELEITESAAMENAEASIATLHALKALGLTLSIDDFGTGYSSLSYLKRLPIDTVKIDRSFVTDLATNPDDASIAQAIISMAHNLGLKVVAEGVETPSQLSFLASHGCDQMQGYYFSKPLPEPEITAMLREGRRLQRPEGDADDGSHTLLLLDDEDNVLSALKRLLRQDNYRIFTANSAKAGFEILANHQVGVIISDQRMPEVTGVDFLRRVKELYPGSVRMVLSGYTDLASVTDAINQGSIYRFLTKPWDDSLLRAHIAEAFRRYALLQGDARAQDATRVKVRDLSLENLRLKGLLEERAAALTSPAAADVHVSAGSLQ